MKRLRSLSRDYLLPLVIGALALRALIPVGFMPGAGAGFSLTAMTCNTQAGGAATETLEIPGVEIPGAASTMHCDYCVAPMVGAPFASSPSTAQVPTVFEPSRARMEAPFSRFALMRAQSPRAPPLA